MASQIASNNFMGTQVVSKKVAARSTARNLVVTPMAAAQQQSISLKKGATLRAKTDNSRVQTAPRILANVEKLRLLSKAEKAGLLTLAEKSGLTLAKIEKLGLLSTAEKFGLLSLASDRSAPSKLITAALACFVVAPGVVYLSPDVPEYVIAAALVVAGSAAIGGSAALSALQKK
eukprot:CAMPEP_0196571992 /NCGR_PEP_ID=MMETSP1081-20130531/2106_1 /TAXON_ID=36882 /ORGANISM="Pyramimonas amylifera, Strain CCMP720" /LENGTH=174 /DNA_ID=CAMNT_0041889147 /DNA_START=95 /DNA_END=619 /DNA_ORIENTATION=+